MPPFRFPPAVLHFRVDTTASIDAIDAVLAEIKRDAPRAAEIRHVKIDANVGVGLSPHGDLVIEARGTPNGIYVQATVALQPNERGTALVGEIFRPGAHAVLAVLLGVALFLVWLAFDGFPFFLIALPILAWIAIVATRIGGSNRRRAELLIQTTTEIARLAEALPAATVEAERVAQARASVGRRRSWFERVGGGTVISGAMFVGYLAAQSFRFLPPQSVREGFARVGGGVLFGGLMGRAWFATRDWNFLGRWTAVVRGVVAGGTSAWLIADLGMPIGTLQRWQIVSLGVAAGVLLGLWSESSEAPAE